MPILMILARITVFLRYSFTILLGNKIFLIVNSLGNQLPAGWVLQNKRQALADGEDSLRDLALRVRTRDLPAVGVMA